MSLPTPPASPAPSTHETLRRLVRTLDEKKAGDLRVLRVAAQSSITDFLVLATGTSEPHLRALRVELEKILDADAMKIAGMDSSDGSGWTVVDAYQIMIHLFTADKRDAYRLEQLWSDAEDIPVADLLADPAAAVAKASAPKAPKAAKPAKAAKVAKAPKAAKARKPAAKAKAKPAKSAKATKAPAAKKKSAKKAAPKKKK